MHQKRPLYIPERDEDEDEDEDEILSHPQVFLLDLARLAELDPSRPPSLLSLSLSLFSMGMLLAHLE
jgi:hypothetical protein